ncbi:MAG: short-chain dehydrogenase [Pseudonocardiales bacterium]|nr:MAG: short-chain dehydrogenase [Pseudonocardiales bacterium]
MTTSHSTEPTALITGASQGFGRAVAQQLSARGWRLVLDARTEADLQRVVSDLPRAVGVTGDVTDPRHRAALGAAVDALGGIDLLVNNASELGPSPMPRLREFPLAAARAVYETNVIAPLALSQLLLASLAAAGGAIVNVSSDAAVEAYEGWGGYGPSKAALDHLGAVLAAEEPAVRVYAFDPGDMRTGMHQRAFPGEDISDRPDPGTVVPALLRLVDERPASGRYRAADLAADAIGEAAR